jgi:hypothetical protein
MQCIKAAGEEFIPKIQQSLLMVYYMKDYELLSLQVHILCSLLILERVSWVLMYHLKL